MRGKRAAAKVRAESSTKRPVMLSDGCRVSRNVTGRTDCGRRMRGWDYGTDADVTCTDVCAPSGEESE